MNINLTTQELTDIEIIKDRWKNNTNMFCEDCMSCAIRHFDRNMDRVCEGDSEESSTDNEIRHFGRYDGNMLAYSAKDVWALLDIIEKLRSAK